MWFVWAYFYRTSDARLTKLAKAKYKTIAGSLNRTINNDYDLTTTSATVNRNLNKIQVTFKWKPKKAGLADLPECTKTYDIKDLCESYDKTCDPAIVCNESNLQCIGK